MITEPMLELLERMSNGAWWEWPLNNQEALNRRLRICVKNGWLKTDRAIQGERWLAYRITGAGLGVYDLHLIQTYFLKKKGGR